VTDNYWPEPGPLREAYWDDPCPEWHGMLSSDLIAYYDEAVGGMIGPWDDTRLKPASYELTLGPNCLINGVIRVLSEADPWLEIPYNSIVFVSMGQWVRLPHYLAARFDLAIEFIYQGILLGTGPQVDPGFQGVLSCPLHNISSDAVHMQLGQPFAKMDFAKTSGLRNAQEGGAFRKTRARRRINDERDLYAAVLAGRLTGRDGKPVRLYKDDKRWREPIFAPGYAGQKLVRSSLKRIEDDVIKSKTEIDDFGDDIRRIRRFGIASAVGIVIAIASLLLGLAQLDRSYTDSRVDRVVEKVDAQPQAVNPQVAQLGREVAQLREQLAEVRGRVEATTPSR
jgi:deoxycytidine triphosphate deaminase